MHNPFKSFWMAGFECSDKLNKDGNRVDFLNITGHLDHVDEDYINIKTLNLKTVREGICWSTVEKQPYCYNWSSVIQLIAAGKRHSVQQIWDICHFGFPDDLSPLHPLFAKRFAALCKAFVLVYRTCNPTGELIIVPINEVSFLSWLGGETCGTTPYCTGYGWQVKYALMRACIEGIKAIKETDSSVRILTSEPLVNMVSPLEATDTEIENAQLQHSHQFQVTDILCGRLCPELGGKPEYLDIIGLNYYYNNQWICNTYNFLIWKDNPPDERWKPLNKLIAEVYERYKCAVIITETSHPKEDRILWFKMIGRECKKVLENNIPLLGVCIYPIIDRPDWDDLVTWHHSGIWDINNTVDGDLKRTLCHSAAEGLIYAQQMVKPLITEKSFYKTSPEIDSTYQLIEVL